MSRPDAAPDGLPATTAALPRPTVRFSVWLAGRIDYEAYLKLAERLAWEASEPEGRGPTLLLCEHADVITMGRLASRRDVQLRR